MKAEVLPEVEAAMKGYSSWQGEQGKKSLNSGRPFVAVACVLMFLEPAVSHTSEVVSTLGDSVLAQAKEHKFLHDQDKGVLAKAIKFVCTSADMFNLKMGRSKMQGQKLEVIQGEQE